MGQFSVHIPEHLMQHENVARFAHVLDELDAYKSLQVYEFESAFNPIRTSNFDFLKKFAYELGKLETAEGMPRHVYENIILNAYNLFRYKGTRHGFRLFAQSFFCGDSEVDDSLIWAIPFLIPDDYIYGYLPNGFDLGNINTNLFIYLFADSVTDFYNAVEVRLVSPYFHIQQVREFAEQIIPYYLPMIDKQGTNVTIRFYGHSPLGNMHINNLLYTP